MLLVPLLALLHTAPFFASSTGIMSLSGNSLLLLVAHQKRSLLKPAEFFIVNLAISDLSMTVTLFPLAISSFFAHRYLMEVALHWPVAQLANCLGTRRSLAGAEGLGGEPGGTGAPVSSQTAIPQRVLCCSLSLQFLTQTRCKRGLVMGVQAGTAVIGAAVGQGSSCTPGSICAHHWDAQGTNEGQGHAHIYLVRCWYLRSMLEPLHLCPALLLEWDQLLGNSQPSFLQRRSLLSSRGQGCQPPPGGKDGLTCRLSLQVAL